MSTSRRRDGDYLPYVLWVASVGRVSAQSRAFVAHAALLARDAADRRSLAWS